MKKMKEMMESYQGRQLNRDDGLWNSTKQNNQIKERGNTNSNNNKSYNEEYNTHFKDLQNNDNIKKKEINSPILKNYNNIQPYSNINDQKKIVFFNNFTNKASNTNNINKDYYIEDNINRNCENLANNTTYQYDGEYLSSSLYNNKNNYKFNNLNLNSHHINKNNIYIHNNIIHEKCQNVNNMQPICNITSNNNIKYRNTNNCINNFNKNGKKRKLIMPDRVMNNFEKKHKLEGNPKDENKDAQNSSGNLVPNLENKLNINSSKKYEENENTKSDIQQNELYKNDEFSQNNHAYNITKTMDYIYKHNNKTSMKHLQTNGNYINDNSYKVKENDILKDAIEYFSNINKYKNEELNSDDDNIVKFDEDNKNICYVCKKNMYIYKCPFCEARTCCLECSKNHKKLFNCKNKLKKDFKIKNVGRNNFNDEFLYKDFLFLQNIEKIVEGNYKFIKVNDYEYKSNIWGYNRDKKTFHIFKQKKIHLLKAPIYTTLHKTNKTSIRNSIIYWTVKVTFSNLNFFVTQDNVSENSTFLQLLHALCTKTETLQSKLTEFFKNLSSLRIYLKNGTKVKELNKNKDMIDNKNKDMIDNKNKDMIDNKNKDMIDNKNKDMIDNKNKDMIDNKNKDMIDNKNKDMIDKITKEQNDHIAEKAFDSLKYSQRNECNFFSVKHTINYALINQSFYEYPHFFFEILYENNIPIPNPLYKDSSISK
ncbi:zinc finger protein, putative [Plasmodium berghei ANKA]|uniref:Zinc finger protein, putative n=1 Tax=Plasmodium berghei (strain Anka) TaxID=5823 RepID=A0A509AQI0_PLABA|nr:zinc finger protein, putative [Plasmodium berghei ANKA]VUC57162.1 zinc finger protein, putative [Plasmodium berghei ANKA]|eukprot:XP_034422941.1 zinc finger protein, putative [Plasmodium berghei ANKA]